MTASRWTLSDTEGDLRLHTGVSGRVSGAGPQAAGEKKHPTISYRAATVESVTGGFRLDGTLPVNGTAYRQVADEVRVTLDAECTPPGVRTR